MHTPRPTSNVRVPRAATVAAGIDGGFEKSFELAAVPAVFCGLGWVVDRLAGTKPVFMIVFALLGVVGLFLRAWFRYRTQMVVEEGKTLAVLAETRRSDDAVAALRAQAAAQAAG